VNLGLFETIRRIVQDEMRQIRTTELAVVQDQQVGSDKYSCSVQLRNSGIVLKNVPVATGKIGLVSIPAVGDLVLVQFIGGDVHTPVITGGVYNDQDQPTKSDDGDFILHLPLGADDDSAAHVELKSKDRRSLRIKLGGGLEIKLQDDDPAVTIDAGGGKGTVQIDGDGAITLKSSGDVKISGNAINVEAQGQLTLKGATVNIN
jgi:phage baseplate assembly protein gpV